MNHRIQLKKLSKTPAHRKAMIRNMLLAFFRHEKIKTTLAKSKVLQRVAERLITRSRKDTVANRRIIAKWIQDKEMLAKLFTTIAPLFMDRKGGYTRITKLGPRYGDASEMVYISLVVFSDVLSKDASQDSSNANKKANKKNKKEISTEETKQSKNKFPTKEQDKENKHEQDDTSQQDGDIENVQSIAEQTAEPKSDENAS